MTLWLQLDLTNAVTWLIFKYAQHACDFLVQLGFYILLWRCVNFRALLAIVITTLVKAAKKDQVIPVLEVFFLSEERLFTKPILLSELWIHLSKKKNWFMSLDINVISYQSYLSLRTSKYSLSVGLQHTWIPTQIFLPPIHTYMHICLFVKS